MQIDWWTLGLQTINFLIVVWLLTRFLYQPVRRVIEQREAADREAAEAAERKAQEAEAARAEYEKKRDALEEEMRTREAQLHADMERERDAALAKAREQAEAELAGAREKIGAEREAALAALRERIAGLARRLAAAALADTGVAPATLDRIGADLERRPEADLAELRGDLAGDGGLSVVTAAPLSAEDQARWRDTLRRHLGQQAQIAFATDPDLLGGAELRFPHARLAFSVADRLDRAAAGIKEA